MNSSKTKRIDFIDLAKGVCILLVVAGHSGAPLDFPGASAMRMPLYFILSGLFYKDYGGFVQFIVKKTNKILVPFLFFYLISYAVFYAAEAVAPGLIKTDATGLMDVFTNRQYFNGPIWFLLALFWANVIFCAVTLNIRSERCRFLCVAAIGALGVFLGAQEFFLPCMIDVACTALPFFYFGYILKKSSLLVENRYDRYNILIAIGLYAVAAVITVCLGNQYFSFHYNGIRGNVLLIYVVSLSGALSILFLCKRIHRLPFVSYFGRYSIIPLCLHHLIYRPIQLVVNPLGLAENSGWVVAGLTIIVCWAMIPLCRKYIPWFTAQKDLLFFQKNF